MKKLGTILAVVLVAACLLTVSAFADGGAFGISADKTEVEAGDTVVVTATVEQNPGVYSVCAKVNFDSSVFEYVSKEIGGFMPAQTTADSLLDLVDMSKDTLTEGTGTMAVVTLRVKDSAAAGTYTVSVDNVESYNMDDEVAFASASVNITVKGEEPSHVHDWGEWTVKTPATCTEKGVEERTCKAEGCDIGTETREVAALGHDWGEWTVVKAATIEEAGLEERVCNNDASHKESREIPKLECEHVWDEGKAVVTKEPTCTEEGEKTFTCTKCGETKVEKIPALGHDWDEGKVTKEPTCTAAGEKTFTCKIDKTHVKTEAIPAKGHDLEKVERVEPTKDKDGNIEYYVCKECHKLFKDKDGKTEIKQEDTVLKYTTPTPAPTKAPAAPGGNAAGNNPKTGDETNIALYVAILTVCGAAAIAVVSKKKNNG